MLVPSRALVLASTVPVLLSLAAVVDPSLLAPVLGVDACLVALAALDAWLARRPLVTVRRRPPRVVSLGRPATVELEVRSTARRPLAVSVVDDVFETATTSELPADLSLPPAGRATVRYRFTAGRRGAHELGAHHVRYPSPLGLWQHQTSVPARDEVRVYPDVGAVREVELLARRDAGLAGRRASRLRGGETEFERLRDYQREDEFRSVDWKASARARKLISRAYQLETGQSLLFVLDAGRLMTAEVSGRALFDHALDATLMLAHVAARGGDQVGLLAFAETVTAYAPPAGGPRAAQRLVRTAYDLLPDLVDSDHGAAAREIGVRLAKRSLLVIFTQVVDEVGTASLLRMVRGVSKRHLPLVVLLRDVEIDALVRGEGRVADEAAGELPYLRAAAAELALLHERCARELVRRGAHVLDVAPQAMTPALVRRYLEIKAKHLL